MIGQGKKCAAVANAASLTISSMWQAEIDAAAELVDFLRFGVKYAEELCAVTRCVRAS